MITSNNILRIMSDNSISYEQLKQMIKRYNSLIIKALNKESEHKIIEYLYDDNFPILLKNKIRDYIDDLKSNDYLHEEKIKRIIILYKINKVFNKDDINKEYIPISFKEIIVNKLYNEDIYYLLKILPINQQKELFDLRKEKLDIKSLLEYNLSFELKTYIIDNYIKTNDSIIYILNSIRNEDIREIIIRRKINYKNLYNILNAKLFPSIKEDIIKIKEKETDDMIKNINKHNLKKMFIYGYNCDLLIDKVLKERMDDLKKVIKHISIFDILSELTNVGNKKIIELLASENKKKIKIAIKTTIFYDMLMLLSNSNVPIWAKEYIINTKFDKIKKEISLLPDNELLRYLSNESKIPLKIKKYILDNKINKNNIINIVSNDNYFNILDYDILRENCDIFKDYLEKKDIYQLIKLEDIKNDNVKELIYNSNYEILKNKLKKLNKNEIIDCLNSDQYTYTLKRAILDNLNIKEDDIQNCIVLLNSNNSSLVLDNYNNIKNLINKTYINFDYLVQYGANTSKYDNWYNILINIINTGKTSEFINISNYLFDNLYEDSNKAKMVENLLQIINNYYSCYSLLSNLYTKKIKLNDNDKHNILYLFKMEGAEKENFKTTNDINLYRLNLYNKIKYYINNKSLDEIKNIINNEVFLRAYDNLQDIGTIADLKILKNYNKDHNNFCKLIDELIYYYKIVENLNSASKKEDLNDFIKYLLKDDNLLKIQNIFYDLPNKIMKVFQYDTSLNLTSLDKMGNLRKKSNYGGYLYDLSDKKYILLAHVVSLYDDIEKLISGKEESGNKNFLSVSPISYFGQKYYYDNDDMIIGYDNINPENFICSSVNNMNSNSILNKHSYETNNLRKKQRGILETSCVTRNNSEILLYRNGLKASCIILPNNKKPSKKEIEFHNKYNLPFVVTQPIMTTIDNAEKLNLENNDITNNYYTYEKDLVNILKTFNNKLNTSKYDIYTGRQIAILTDIHAMYEPLVSVLEDIEKRKIKEIYSLGDNIGLGTNPTEVLDLLDELNVKSISGNSEYYNTLGVEPFNYFDDEKLENQIWTYEKLGNDRIKKLQLYPPSIDIIVGNKKIALCHFINDVRWDFTNHSTYMYQHNFEHGESGKQFLYTNSSNYKKDLNILINTYDTKDKKAKGLLDSKKIPLFNGKEIKCYDAILQGHVHFDMFEKINNTNIHTLRALAMGSKLESSNNACYYILKEKKDSSYTLEKVLVKFNKNSLISNIVSSDIPNKGKVLNYLKR